jgi:hypothetical protein
MNSFIRCGEKGLDEFIETLTKNEIIYWETATNECHHSTAAVAAPL